MKLNREPDSPLRRASTRLREFAQSGPSRRGLLLAAFGLSMALLGREVQRRDVVEQVRAFPSVIAHEWRSSTPYRSLLPKLDRMVIDLDFEDYQRIAADRELALARGILLPGQASYVTARLRVGQEDVAGRVRLKGDLRHNWRTDKWSLRVKVKGDQTLLGMKWLSLQDPNAGDGLREWALLHMMRADGLPAVRYTFVDVTINGTDLGVFALEENFERRLIENNERREGPILKFNEDLKWLEWFLFQSEEEGMGSFSASSVEPMDFDDARTPLFREAVELMTGFQSGSLRPSDVFDLEKTARFVAYKELIGAVELDWNDLRFYYNPITARLEPVAYEIHSTTAPLQRLFSFAGGMKRRRRFFLEQPDSFARRLFSDVAFSQAYVAELDRISRPGHLETLLDALEPEMLLYLKVLRAEYPDMEPLDLSRFRGNQERIRAFLAPAKPIHAYTTSTDSTGIELRVGNLQSLPVEVMALETSSLSVPITMPVLEARTYFGNPELKSVSVPVQGVEGQEPLRLRCRIFGLEEEIEVPVYPWSIEQRRAAAPLVQRAPNVSSFSFVEEDEKGDGWYIAPGDWTIHTTMIIPDGGVLRAGPNTRLTLEDGASIVSHSPVDFRGGPENPTVVRSESGGGGLLVVSADAPSRLHHVLFENLSSPADERWGVTGAVTFYKSELHVSDVTFVGMRAEDALNVVHSPFELERMTISGSQSDALDVDFSDGSIFDCEFFDSGNDAIDVSGSRVHIEQTGITRAGDKGLSVGEASWVNVLDVAIAQANIAVASKDNSSIEALRLTCSDSNFAFAVYQKKPEFGPAQIDADLSHVEPSDTPHLIERGSRLDLNWRVHDGDLENVAAMLYEAAGDEEIER